MHTYKCQGCAGRPFIPQGGAGRGKGKNPQGGAGRGGAKVKIRRAGRGEKARKSTKSKILQKCEKYNITYYIINYNYKINDLNQSYHCSVGPSYN